MSPTQLSSQKSVQTLETTKLCIKVIDRKLSRPSTKPNNISVLTPIVLYYCSNRSNHKGPVDFVKRTTCCKSGRFVEWELVEMKSKEMQEHKSKDDGDDSYQ